MSDQTMDENPYRSPLACENEPPTSRVRWSTLFLGIAASAMLTGGALIALTVWAAIATSPGGSIRGWHGFWVDYGKVVLRMTTILVAPLWIYWRLQEWSVERGLK